MAKVIGVGSAKSASQTIHDPTCGSGSLLLKAHDEAKSATGLDLALYGQEMDNATTALARMNMILHDCPTAEIWQDNTLSAPHFKDAKTAASRPSTSSSPIRRSRPRRGRNGFDPANDQYGRFAFGVPPQKNGDYAFLLHILACLKSTGKGAVILPHGVLFRGGAEADIRREIVRRGYIKGIIGLPANLFYGTGIPACIIVLDKENAAARKGIFMIDASQGLHQGRQQEPPARAGHPQDRGCLHAPARDAALLAHGAARRDQRPEERLQPQPAALHRHAASPRTCRTSTATCAAASPTATSTRSSGTGRCSPACASALFKKADRPGYSRAQGRRRRHQDRHLRPRRVHRLRARRSRSSSRKWRARPAPAPARHREGRQAQGADRDARRGAAGHASRRRQLLDAYDVYQHLMDYWAETMQDDVYLIASDGWREAAKPRQIVEDKDKKSKDKPDFIIGKQKFKADLIPPALLIARYFAAEQAAIEKLEAEAAAVDAGDGGAGRGARRRGRAARRGQERQGQAHQGVGVGPAQGHQERPRRRRRAQGARATTWRSIEKEAGGQREGQGRAGRARPRRSRPSTAS